MQEDLFLYAFDCKENYGRYYHKLKCYSLEATSISRMAIDAYKTKKRSFREIVSSSDRLRIA